MKDRREERRPLVASELDAGVFRTHPEIRLRLLDRLSSVERRALDLVSAAPEIFGVAESRDKTGRHVVIDHETALLLFALREPSLLPRYVIDGMPAAELHSAITRLILDGLLQIWRGHRFVSGAAALALGSDRSAATGFLACLSEQALEQAARLRLTASELTSRLYAFPRLPWTARWARLLASGGVEAYLGLSGRVVERRCSGWERYEGTAGWLSWIAADSERKGRRSLGTESSRFKLYISPTPEALRETIDLLLEALPAGRARQFKVGAEGPGILRPDKLVVYFDALDHLKAFAEIMAPSLSNIPAHGVPFTAPLRAEGLMSWGIDPPHLRSFGVGPRESWRLFVARSLASALVVAREDTDGWREQSRFALQRLKSDGIDVDSWTPSKSLWSSPGLAAA